MKNRIVLSVVMLCLLAGIKAQENELLSAVRKNTAGGGVFPRHILKDGKGDFLSAPSYKWARTYGGDLGLELKDFVTDDIGDIYVCGLFRGTVHFGTDMFTSTGDNDMLVAKLDTNGSVLWVKTYPAEPEKYCWATSISMGPDYLVYITGSFNGSVTFGNNTLTSSETNDAFVLALGSDGQEYWSQAYGSESYSEIGNKILVDNANGIYVLVDQGTYTDPLSFSHDSCAVLKYDMSGNLSWEKKTTAKLFEISLYNSVVYATGNLFQEESFGEPVITPTTDNSLILFSLDSYGSVLSAEEIGYSTSAGSYNTEVNDMEIDESGNILIGGLFSGNYHFGTDDFTCESASYNGFICSYKTDGTYNFGGAVLSGSSTSVRNIFFLGDTTFYVEGYFEADLSLLGNSLTYEAGNEFFGHLSPSGVVLDPLGKDADTFIDLLGLNGNIYGMTSNYIKKINGQGNFLWSYVPVSTEGHAMVWYTHDINKYGQTVIQGMTLGYFEMGDSVFNLTTDRYQGYISKLDPEGNPIWTQLIKSNAGLIPSGVVFANDGDIIAWGTSYSDTITIGNKVIYSTDNLDLAYIVRLDPEGNVRWLKSLSYSGTMVGVGGICVDGDGNATITGYHNGTLMLDGVTKISDGTDFFIVQVASDGSTNWWNTYGGASDQYATSIACDNEGDLYVTGRYTGTLTFDTYSFPSAGSYDFFIARLTADGVVKWVKSFGSASSDLSRVISLDHQKNIYINGYSSPAEAASISLGTMTIDVDPAYYTGYTIKLDQEGTPIWVSIIKSTFLWTAYKTDVDENDNFYTQFSIADTLAIHAANIDINENGYGGGSGVFMKYSPDGSLVWAKSYNGYNQRFTNATSIAVYAEDQVSIAGRISSERIAFDENTILDASNENAFVLLIGGDISPSVVQGKVTTEAGGNVTSGKVELYNLSQDAISSAEASATLSEDGTYVFEQVPRGKYIIKVEADTTAYPGAIITYYKSAARWLTADTLVVENNDTVSDVNIQLIQLPVLNGNATLSGTVVENDTKSAGITKALKSVQGRPVKSASVVLVGRTKSSENIVAQTVTDENGFYEFSKVPVGQYDILVDIPGLAMETYYTVTVNETDTEINDLNYQIGTEGVVISKVDPVGIRAFSMYPNPSHNMVNLMVSQDKIKTYTVIIRDMQGRIRYTQRTASPRIQLELNLESGYYIVQLLFDNQVVNKKLVIE